MTRAVSRQGSTSTRLQRLRPNRTPTIVGVLFVIAQLALTPLAAESIEEAVAAQVEPLLDTYRHLYANAEISYQEKETAAYLAGRLRELGFDVTEEVGDYGVEGRTSYGLVAVMENSAGPTVMVRTDLDGLPIAEKTDLPFASTNTGVADDGEEVPTMHACGHDVHMTSLLGTARLLSEMNDRWSGTLVMIGQPAEERGAGSRAMLEDGLYERFPRPDYVLALHSDAGLAAGKVGLVPGYALASVDSVDITIRGKGGHGAWPHTTHDPVTLAAKIVMNLQTIVSRRVSPFDPAVITVGSIHGGSKHNIIPDEVKLQVTVRSYKPEVRELLLKGIRSTAIETARSAGFPPELEPIVNIPEEEYTPSTYNDPDLVERLRGVFTEALGGDRVVARDPVMGGEDFSRYALDGEVPITMFWLGAVEPAEVEAARESGETLPSLHSAEFAPDAEPAIRTGVTAMTAAALDLLQP